MPQNKKNMHIGHPFLATTTANKLTSIVWPKSITNFCNVVQNSPSRDFNGYHRTTAVSYPPILVCF